MKYLIFTLLLVNTLWLNVPGQTCGVAQTLTALQQAKLSKLIVPLDTALKREDLFHIDSLSIELKSIYSTEGGRPGALESYYNLTSKTNWLNVTDAVLLSRVLIATDSMVYVNLWKAGKGMKPPLYQPNSLFLRASAEIASGLLKIAAKESNPTRKAAYQSWATRALDSLATMQLPNGAFPFPDLRTYGDPVFKSIIQNFLNRCGADSVKILKAGWIVDDKGSGEFKFDAGVIANAYYEAYLYTGKTKYKTIAIAVGNFLKPLKFNTNYNYNTFVSLGLTRAFQLTNDPTYLNRAIVNLRYAVYPGQITNGRWMDGHNANSRYHSIIIQNIVPTVQLVPTTNSYKSALETMTLKAVKNMIDYTINCGSATGYRWLLKAYGLNSVLLPATVKNTVTDLIGQQINQSSTNGKYLDIPTMGEYMELVVSPSSNYLTYPEGVKVRTFPNPTNGITNLAFSIAATENILLSVFDVTGRLIKIVDEGKRTSGAYTYQIDLSQEQAGVYFLILKTTKQKYTSKIIRTE